MNRLRSTVFALAAAFLLPATALAQLTIEGRVKTEDGGRLPENMRVLLLGDSYQQLQMQYIDAGGRFRFDVASRRYYVQVEPGGGDYERQQISIEPSPNPYSKSGRETMYPNITLRLRDSVRRERSAAPVGSKKEVFVQAVPPPAREAYDKGEASIEKKDYAGGTASLRQAIEIYPDYFDALEALGTEMVRQKNYEEAISLLRRSILVNNGAWKSHYALGAALADIKQPEEALKELRRSVELNPSSPNSHMRLGLELSKDPATYADAINSFERVKALTGKNVPPDTHFYLASLYSKQKQYKEAADSLEAYVAASAGADAAQREQYKKAIRTLREKAEKP